MNRTIRHIAPKTFDGAAIGKGQMNPAWLRHDGREAVAFCGMSMVSAGLPTGLVAIPIVPPPLLSVAVVWRRDDNSPVLQRLIDFLRERRDRAGEPGWPGEEAGAPAGAAAHFGN